MNQCIRLMELITKFAESRPVDEIKLATVGIISILGNLRLVCILYISYFLNKIQ